MPDLALEHAAEGGVLLRRNQLLQHQFHLGLVRARVLVQFLACTSTALAQNSGMAGNTSTISGRQHWFDKSKHT